ncbi:similar to Saccharomyces cerevisiae YGR042W Putative protein of unknown function [Maudiozyma barnettii]|uniref:5'-3' DNA helicase ZGRF1-like N-terminal domain-containing protein n=1 Tax=Maudiozyma barnettii TaxID=61262 RepID=A0A8H2ZFQ7_9SACH|nr:Mte1p [Kazachstania barnettii]CAB4252574.1 similar to Saccharomyces cerevisiae YGR042W Putative protein of unknown function [Kazachstania barnettii]CAD1779311.1 similar to Saccharomyces cerevisiae YGR042W Putative protein of unknown function [Kazachstania barnettii]
MISHVVEYSCQYSDQIRKKHKTWHDGKLKYYAANNRFMLYPEESNVLISSNFITNSRDVSTILDAEGFNTVEHKIFSRAVVIITEMLCEYDREVQIQKAKESPILHMQRKDENIRILQDNYRTSKKDSFLQNGQKDLRKRILIKKDYIRSNETGNISLALKFNKPFKPPGMKKSIRSLEKGNQRPAIRNSKIILQNNRVKKNKKGTKINHEHTDEIEESTKPKISPDKIYLITKDNEISQIKKNCHVRITGNSKRKKIDHTPIIL